MRSTIAGTLAGLVTTAAEFEAPRSVEMLVDAIGGGAVAVAVWIWIARLVAREAAARAADGR